MECSTKKPLTPIVSTAAAHYAGSKLYERPVDDHPIREEYEFGDGSTEKQPLPRSIPISRAHGDSKSIQEPIFGGDPI